MATELAYAYPPVRVLKKVRVRFLHKNPEQDDPDNNIPNVHHLINKYMNKNQESQGHINQKEKLCIGPQYLHLCFNIASAVIENQSGSKMVTLNLTRKENFPSNYWEVAAQRLEKFADLQFETWVHRLRTHNEEYRKAMSHLDSQFKSEDPLVQAALRKTQRKAVLTCREIESKYSFQKYLQLLKKDAHELLSCSYSEGLVKEMGHTAESLMEKAKGGEIPNSFDVNNEMFQNVLKEYINYIPTLGQPIKEGEELETIICDQDGQQRKVRVKFIAVFEPSLEASFNHCYFAVSKADTSQEEEIQEDDDKTNFELKKRRKGSNEG